MIRAGAPEDAVTVAFGTAGAPPRQFQVNVVPGGLSTVVVSEPR